ncbi:hypothetical protein EGH21_15365 [Halomicroarcula sp. F13]|uniref:Halobacterial output domain-containing protein n=1 Tax=Haloarcula rubra TaxID=2487747 RepID=A0AAW4PTD2_9EURY|nr:HalOD1 output domain-containing protein [Halomicroarcula rubra]MBX0324407.1 hypothetical protein [Halomicroarcula rubra]
MTTTSVGDVLAAIAKAEDVEPDDLELVLENYVACDAISTLTKHGDGDWQLSFEVPDHEVTLTSDGDITVDGTVEHHWTDDSTRF